MTVEVSEKSVEMTELTDLLSVEGFQGPVLCMVCGCGYELSFAEPRDLNGNTVTLFYQKCINGCGSEIANEAAAKANKAEAERVGATRQSKVIG